MNIRSIFNVSTTTGALTREINGTLVDSALTTVFYSRDKVAIGVRFFAGDTDVTAEVLAASAILRSALRRFTGTGPVLAQSVTYTLIDGVAQQLLDLNTTEMATYMDQVSDSVTERPAYLEFEVTSADGTQRLTFNQTKATIRCEVNMEGDEPPPEAAESSETATAAANRADGAAGRAEYAEAAAAATAAALTGFLAGASLTALATHAAVRAIPAAGGVVAIDSLRSVVIGGVLEIWHFRAGTDADDDYSILRPDDYNASINAHVWEIVSRITKAMVGLGNAADADTTNAANISSGTLSGARLPAFTGGDVTSTAGLVALILATVNANTGAWGSATQVPSITVDGKGRVIAVSNITITPAWSSVTGKPTTAAGAGFTNGATIDSWGSKTAPAGAVVGLSDTQILTGKELTNEIETVQALTDGASIAWDMSLGGIAVVTLGGNRTISNPTNARAGATYILEIVQDGTGGRNVTWGSDFVWASDTSPSLTATAGRRDIVSFYCRGGKLYGSASLDFA